MKTAYRYLCYGLKKSLLRTVIFTVIAVIISMMIIRSDALTGYVQYRETGIYILATLLGVIATILPILELSEFKNRRNLDTLYFFPIERKKMALVHYFSGLIQMTAIYTVTYGIAFIFLLLNTDYFALGYMIPYYFASLGIGIVMYSFFSFTFNQGNTVTDGIIISLLWAFVAYVVMYMGMRTVLREFFGMQNWADPSWRELYRTLSAVPSWGIVYAPINNLTVIFQNLIEVNKQADEYYYSARALEYASQWYMFVAWGVAGIASAVGFIFGFARKGAHLAGEPSSSWFGYKTLIPIYGYMLLMYLAAGNAGTIAFILTIIAMFIGYVIYRRSFRLKKSDIIVLCCSIVPIVIGAIIDHTHVLR